MTEKKKETQLPQSPSEREIVIKLPAAKVYDTQPMLVKVMELMGCPIFVDLSSVGLLNREYSYLVVQKALWDAFMPPEDGEEPND